MRREKLIPRNPNLAAEYRARWNHEMPHGLDRGAIRATAWETADGSYKILVNSLESASDAITLTADSYEEAEQKIETVFAGFKGA